MVLEKLATIKEEDGRFKLLSSKGKVLGTHTSYEKALRQERAIQISKRGEDMSQFPMLEKRAGMIQRGIDKLKGLMTGNAYLYHGTTHGNAAKILKEGLRPNAGLGATPTSFIDSSTKGLVFTSDDKGIARSYARTEYLNKKLKELSGKIAPKEGYDQGKLSIKMKINHIRKSIASSLANDDARAPIAQALGSILPIKSGKVLRIAIPKKELQLHRVSDPAERNLFISDKAKKYFEKHHFTYDNPISADKIKSTTFF